MSDQLKDDAALIRSLLPDWVRRPVPAGLDSSFYGTGSAAGDAALSERVNAALERLSTPPRWTPIEEAGEMPVDKQVVWAEDDTGKVKICRYHDDGDAATAWNGFWMLNTDEKFRFVVRWMPAVTPNPEDYEVKP